METAKAKVHPRTAYFDHNTKTYAVKTSKQARRKKKEQIEHTNKWKGIGSLRRGGEATRTFVKERPTHGKKKKATNIKQGKQKPLRKTIQAKKKTKEEMA